MKFGSCRPSPVISEKDAVGAAQEVPGIPAPWNAGTSFLRVGDEATAIILETSEHTLFQEKFESF
jgi:hypothetical protein